MKGESVKMTVLYYCFGPQTVWISTIMSETVYAEYRNIIVIREELAEHYDLSSCFFSKVYIKPSGLTEAEWLDELQGILDEEKPDTFAVFTWGGDTNLAVYNAIPDGMKVVLIDEGTASYNYEKHFSVFSGVEDFSRISEVWLIDPNFSLNDRSIPTYRIPIKEYLADSDRFEKYITRVNQWFRYSSYSFSRVMYFDNYFVSGRFLPEEFYNTFVDSIMKMIQGSGITIKPHPTESGELFDRRYRNYDVKQFSDYKIPWEVVVLNSIFEKRNRNREDTFPRLLMSVNTSALITSQVLLEIFGYEVSIVFLYRLLHDWLPDKINVTEEVLGYYKRVYPNRASFYPETWEELADDLNREIGVSNREELDFFVKKADACVSEMKHNYGKNASVIRRFDRISPMLELSEVFRGYFENKGYDRIAIYGYGDVGRLLKSRLLADGMETVVAEKRAGKGILSLNELKKVADSFDLIVITPIRDFDRLKEELGNANRIIGYEDLIAEVRKYCRSLSHRL